MGDDEHDGPGVPATKTASSNPKNWSLDSSSAAEPAVVGLQALRLTPGGYVRTPDSGYPLSKKSRFSAAGNGRNGNGAVGRGGVVGNKSKKVSCTLKPPG